MAYLLAKVALFALICATTLAVTPSSDAYSNIETMTCCPEGFNEAGIYCVKCAEPKHWNPNTQQCQTCEPGHAWDNNTHTCSCCDLPR